MKIIRPAFLNHLFPTNFSPICRRHNSWWRGAHFDLYSALMTIKHESSLSCQTYHDTENPFKMVTSEDPWHPHLQCITERSAVELSIPKRKTRFLILDWGIGHERLFQPEAVKRGPRPLTCNSQSQFTRTRIIIDWLIDWLKFIVLAIFQLINDLKIELDVFISCII